MIGKQKTGKGFRGVLKYILNPQKGYLVGGNMVGTSPRELDIEFSESRMLNSLLRKPVYHVSLSLLPQEGLNDEIWNEISARYIREMGFVFSQYCVARHTDREHEHIHIVASRIGLNGKTVSDSNNFRRSEQIIRGIERDYKLTSVRSSYETDRRALSSGELRLALKTNQPSVRMLLQEIIDQELKKSLTMTELAKNLKYRGVKVIPNIAATGNITGLTYEYNGEKMKGSNLGKGYTFAGIQRRGIHYDVFRDRDAMVFSKGICLPRVKNNSENAVMVRFLNR